MLMAVPVGAEVVWNVHRIYGRCRLSRLFARLSLFAFVVLYCVRVWCMNMYVCVYTYVYVCVYTYIYVCV